MKRYFERYRLTAPLVGLTVLFGTPVVAAEPEYRATAVKPVNGKFISEEAIWRCVEGKCTAQRSSGARRLVCPKLARKIGKIDSFSFRGTPLAAAALAECNRKAR